MLLQISWVPGVLKIQLVNSAVFSCRLVGAGECPDCGPVVFLENMQLTSQTSQTLRQGAAERSPKCAWIRSGPGTKRKRGGVSQTERHLIKSEFSIRPFAPPLIDSSNFICFDILKFVEAVKNPETQFCSVRA